MDYDDRIEEPNKANYLERHKRCTAFVAGLFASLGNVTTATNGHKLNLSSELNGCPLGKKGTLPFLKEININHNSKHPTQRY